MAKLAEAAVCQRTISLEACRRTLARYARHDDRSRTHLAREKSADLVEDHGAQRLERLSGDRAGQHSIRINDQWRICFRWDRGDVHDVEITDYH